MPVRTQTTARSRRYSLSNVSIVSDGGYRPIYMNRARTTFYAVGLGSASRYSRLYQSIDGGSTWTSILDFNTLHSNCDFLGLLELPSGEMLAGTSSFGSFAARVYKSTGFTSNPVTASWTLKHTNTRSPLNRSYTMNERCLGTNGIVLVGESGAQTEGLAAQGLTKVSGGSGYTTATVSAVSGGSGEDIRAGIYNGEVYRIGIFNGGTGHANGTHSFSITGDGTGANWTYTVAGGVIDGVQSSAARGLFLSTDYGETFTEIFDIFNPPASVPFDYGIGLHLHGAVYDEDWDRIWLLTGDNTGDGMELAGTGKTQICYSDDRGTTWAFLDGETYLLDEGIESQYTSIRVFRDCVVVGTDALVGAGIMIFPKTGFRSLGDAYFGPTHVNSNTQIYNQNLSAFSQNDDYPVFANYGNSGTFLPDLMTTPTKGFDWDYFWYEDNLTTRPAIAGGAINVMYGPDTNNRMLGYYSGYAYHLKGILVTN